MTYESIENRATALFIIANGLAFAAFMIWLWEPTIMSDVIATFAVGGAVMYGLGFINDLYACGYRIVIEWND